MKTPNPIRLGFLKTRV